MLFITSAYEFVLQAETRNNQLKAEIPAHSTPELRNDMSASRSNSIGRPTIVFEFSVLCMNELQCINHNDFIFERYPWNNCEICVQGLFD